MTDNPRNANRKLEGPKKAQFLLDDYSKAVIWNCYPSGKDWFFYDPGHYWGDPTERVSMEGEG